MKANDQVEHEVLELIDEFLNAYMRRDKEKALAFFVPDEDLVVFGTHIDETDVGLDSVRANLEHDFEIEDNATFKITWNSVSASGDVAWVAAEYDAAITVEDQDFSFHGRSTFILERRDTRWLIVHAHLSIPADS